MDLLARANAANQLAKDGRDDDALAEFRAILGLTALAPIRAGCFNSIALILAGRGQNQRALELCHEAARICPGLADSYNNIGMINLWLARLPDAMRWFDRALALDPWHEQAAFGRATALLLEEDYLRGFQEYECRWRSNHNGLAKISACWPEWNGANGRRVFIYGEQGTGDTLCMLRYARLIHAAGVHQAWVVQRGLRTLVESMGVIDHVLETGDPLPEFDCHLPAASLPRLFKTTAATIPTCPYLPVPAINSKTIDYQLRVGIAWRGSKAQGNDRFRSTNLDHWREVLAVPNVEFHSLQVDAADEALFYPQLVQSLPPATWLETARRLQALDLIISVDTSLIHLAGALGLNCWCALHCRPYFVYPLTRPDSPWYPTVRLFKQTREFDWTAVFATIAHELKSEAARHTLQSNPPPGHPLGPDARP